MGRRSRWILAALLVLAIAGCGGSTPSPPVVFSDPAIQAAHDFLEAVVKGNSDRATQLLTPIAAEKMKAGGKQFKLPGIANYSYKVGDVRYPSSDKAIVQCKGTDRAADGKTIEEEFCWLLVRVGDQWRVSSIMYAPGPKQPWMIFSFEKPEQGAVPIQQMMARTTEASANGASQSPPRTAHEATPAAAYR